MRGTFMLPKNNMPLDRRHPLLTGRAGGLASLQRTFSADLAETRASSTRGKTGLKAIVSPPRIGEIQRNDNAADTSQSSNSDCVLTTAQLSGNVW